MTRHALILLFLAACMDDGTEETFSEVEAWSSSTQGSSYQGSSYQGSSYQGSSYQGSSYQGSSYQGSSYQGMTYGSIAVTGSIASKTTIETWRYHSSGTWEKRTPDQRCYYYPSGTTSCTSYGPYQLSPLAGLTFPTTFKDPATGEFRAGKVRIKSQVGAVVRDNTLAMHPLNGAGVPGTPVAGNPWGECTNSNGCRRNTDLWLYQIELVDSNGAAFPFCADGGKAFAINGTWTQNGARLPSNGQFTFACTVGTIAKCTRWGYRPFGVATKVNGQTVSMADYHQTCIRAASADYCANGNSYTKDGTLVDIYDYEPQQGNTGFIPRTLSTTSGGISTTFVRESTFDKLGATEMEFQRYQELGNLYFDCPAISLGTAPMPDQYHIPMMRDISTWTTPRISIDSTVGCSHSEETLGRSLHPNCSKCTYRMWQLDPGNPCLHGGPGAWTEACRKQALDQCHSPIYLGVYPRMAVHSECTTGTNNQSLDLYDSACTMNICAPGSPTASCCGAGGWTSQCVAAANARCKNGREGGTDMFGNNIGFCGTAIPLVNDGVLGGGGTVGGDVGGIGGGGVLSP